MGWHNYQGNKVSYGTINAGATKAMNTYASHPWSAVALNDAGVFMSVDAEEVYVPVAGDAGRTIVIEPYESKTAGSLITLTFVIGAGQRRRQGTYASHPWSVTGKADASAILVVDG